jgi:hypothetical protein
LAGVFAVAFVEVLLSPSNLLHTIFEVKGKSPSKNGKVIVLNKKGVQNQ